MGSKNAMANYLRRISSKEGGGGGGGGGRGNKPNDQGQGHCKRHPKHRQSPGVCSLCLGEKLSQYISAHSSSSRKKTTIHRHHHDEVDSASCSSSSSLSSYYSSSSATNSCSSPMHGEGKGGGASLTLLLFSGKNRLTKSRSVAFASRNMRGKEVVDHQKKDGFFSKLLHPRRAADHRQSKKEAAAAAGLAHSRTVRDILTSS